ncbi:hypothetical protein F5148DRAFT_1203012 [Russula earlei]|uniref:Uncharacterized protein n=1 Tax=Russula earlei TaxID=71964 RepID=A0ACC0U980_9AGAM|nr:hypothetical protein F5148DRAFT_1203012 [Russula earlei]
MMPPGRPLHSCVILKSQLSFLACIVLWSLRFQSCRMNSSVPPLGSPQHTCVTFTLLLRRIQTLSHGIDRKLVPQAPLRLPSILHSETWGPRCF